MAHLTPSQRVWQLAIKHRVRRGRLRRVWRGVYAVGRRNLSREGWWMAAVLACGDDALLSHSSAAQLWGMLPYQQQPIHVSVPRRIDRRRRGILVHRRRDLGAEDGRTHEGIPVTNPALTLVDLAATSSDKALERAINEADKADLIGPDALRAALRAIRRPGAGRLRRLLDRPTFVLTDSELERLFVPIAIAAGLPVPETQVTLHGHRVDFFFREHGLVVETDGLRYHRTPTQQSRDRIRDQAHTAAGLTVLRFTHAQVRHEPAYVEDTLARTATARDRVAARARGARRRPPSRPGRAASA